MATSQNGWGANDRSVISTRTVPGSNVRIAVRDGAAGDLILEALACWDRLVEDLDQGADDWGYAERPVRGGTDLSNHASGTAGDGNATRHPLGTDPAANFTRPQIEVMDRIVQTAGGALRWGGRYSGRKDGMHIEAADGSTEASCARGAAALRALREGGAPVLPPSSGPTIGLLVVGMPGPNDDVRRVQHELRSRFPLYAGALAVDGMFGPATERAVREFQRRSGLEPDGKVGRLTRAALGL